MKILQGGYPKSGNYWLYKIISEILNEAGIEKKSFIKKHPIYQIAKDWKLSYPEHAGIDMLDIRYVGNFFRISSRYREKLEGDEIKNYVENSTHVWTHSNYCERSKEVFKLFDKLVYIIRDPRDIAISSAKFAFTPYMQKHYPTRYETPDDFLEGELESITKAWGNHVLEYLEYASNHQLYIIFYERFLQNFDEELEGLLKFIGLHLSDEKKQNIKQKVSFNRMKEESPGHVRNAQLYSWMKQLSNYMQSLALQNARPVISFLNYPESGKDGNKLPQLSRLNKKKLQELKEDMEGKSLVEQLRDMVEEVRS